MKKNTVLLILLAMFFTTGGTAYAADWVTISGTVLYEETPLNVMVLANGQYMFTDPADGRYEMEVPIDENGKITLFSFCDGLAPFRQVLNPNEAEDSDIRMSPAPPDSMNMSLTCQVTHLDSGWAEISGTATYEGSPLNIMVLANGQHTFTSESDGKYELEVPLDDNGEITLFGFCDGLAPFRKVSKMMIDFAYLQYRTYSDHYEYRGWLNLSARGEPINESDVRKISLEDSSGTPVSISSTPFYRERYYEGIWNHLTNRFDSFDGPAEDSGFSIEFPDDILISAGEYTYKVTTNEGDIVARTMYFPGAEESPAVKSESMKSRWTDDGSLEMTWANPSESSHHMRLTLMDQDWDTLVYILLPPGADETEEITLALSHSEVQKLTDFGSPSGAKWQIDTRYYTDEGMNYARGYSDHADIDEWMAP
ncbi:hypothetical protein QUF80_18455 [Desulfococcaceae bacterium HSG8]|nr:hypothetical protein [Desulfococcaceae bacterium HSG8]